MASSKDWNEGGDGLPFILPGATEAQVVPASSVGLVAPVGTRKHERLTAAVNGYIGDGHDPEIWFGRRIASTGEGTASVAYTVVRCRRCDHRTFAIGAGRRRYRQSECVPVTAEEVLERERVRSLSESVTLLRVFAGIFLLLAALFTIAVLTDVGVSADRVAIVAAMALVATALLVGSHDRSRCRTTGEEPRPWFRTGWGRVAVLAIVPGIIGLATSQEPDPPQLQVARTRDPAHPSAPGCSILPADRPVQVFGITIPVAAFGTATGEEAVPGMHRCGATRPDRFANVAMTCIVEGADLTAVVADAPEALVLDQRVPTTRPGVSSVTWQHAGASSRGVLAARGSVLVQVSVGGMELGELTDRIQDAAVRQATTILDYVDRASHVSCVPA